MKVVKELPISIYNSIKLILTPISVLNSDTKETLPVIVSLTSIPSRLSTLHLVIRSLLVQDVRPKKILLWLNDDLKNTIPKKLSRLESTVFEIRYSALNCSHRKLIHSLKAYPEDSIITCDDDLMYRNNWLSKIYQEHLKHPKAIIGNHTVHINHDTNDEPLPFKQWRNEFVTKVNPKAFVPIGAWGILYPPHSLSKETTEKELFLKLAPKADDLWFKAMALVKGTLSIQAEELPKDPIPIIGSQKVALKKDNLGKDKNTEQWQALNNEYHLNKIILER